MSDADAHQPAADDDSPRARRAVAREARQAAAEKRREQRAAAKAFAAEKRQAARASETGGQPAAVEEPLPEPIVVEEPLVETIVNTEDDEVALPEPVRPARQQARDIARQERAEAKETARRERQERRAEKQDHIVEAPREPKKGLLDRWRTSSGREGGTGGGRRALRLVAGAIGALALICSFVLAGGALVVALGAGEGSSAYDTLTALCDGLVGPLRDVFSFSGADAQMKESLIAWGAGSMAYLVLGVLAQSFRRSRLDA